MDQRAEECALIVGKDRGQGVFVVSDSVHSTKFSIVEISSESTTLRVVVRRTAEGQVVAVFEKREEQWEQLSCSEQLSETVVGLCRKIEPLSEGLREEEGEQCSVDVGYLMSVLSREQLELVVLNLCSTFPQVVDLLTAEARKPVNLDDFKAKIEQILRQFDEEEEEDEEEDSVDPMSAFEQIIEVVKNYVQCRDYSNAIALLLCVSEVLVSWTCQHEKIVRDDSSWFEQAFAMLEEGWQQLIELISSSESTVDYGQQKSTFKKLAECRQRLVPILGPIFSDPLRSFKLHIEKRKRTEEKHDSLKETTSKRLKKNKQ